MGLSSSARVTQMTYQTVIGVRHPELVTVKRPQTQYTQAHDLGGIAMRYLDCCEGSFLWKIRQLLEDDSTAIDPAVVQTWHDLNGSPPCLSREIQRAAFAIPWMGLRVYSVFTDGVYSCHFNTENRCLDCYS